MTSDVDQQAFKVKGQGHSVKTSSDRQIIALLRKSDSLNLMATQPN